MSNPYEASPLQPMPGQMDKQPPYLYGLDLGRAVKAPFQSANWVMNVVWVVICFLLSMVVIGGVVLMGYQFEVVERRSRGKNEAWPDFDPNRFVDYLVRGLWPYLVQLILGMGLMIPIVIVGGIFMGIMGAIFGNGGGGEPSPILGLAFFLLVIVLAAISIFATLFVVGPCTFRAGLANDFAEGFKFPWAINAGKLMWGQFLLAMLYSIIIVIVAEFVGALACLIGLLVTLPLSQLMITDLGVQLYDIYLTRGGEPVPIRERVI